MGPRPDPRCDRRVTGGRHPHDCSIAWLPRKIAACAGQPRGGSATARRIAGSREREREERVAPCSGWIHTRLQLGYRFSLDYMLLRVARLAIGGRTLTRVARALVVVGIAVNLFGALTFNRSAYYVSDTTTYTCVVAH